MGIGALFALLAIIFQDEGEYILIPLIVYAVLFFAIGIPLFVLKIALWNKKVRQLKRLDRVK